MRSSVRLALLTVAFGLLLTEPLPAYAVVSPQPGDTCTGGQTGYFTTNAGSLQQPGLFLVCDGSHWNLFQSFTTAGNVGIGTTSPSQALTIGGTSPSLLMNGSSSDLIDFGTTGLAAPGAGSLGEKLRLYGSGAVSTNDYAIGVDGSNMWFQYDGSSPTTGGFSWNSGGTEIVRFTGNGNVGIGTTSPVEALNVYGNVAVDNSHSYLVTLASGNRTSLAYVDGSGIMNIGNGAFNLNYANGQRVGQPAMASVYLDANSNYLTLTTNSSERLRITSAGNVGIGTTMPSEALDVYSGHLLARGGSTPTTFSGCGTSPSASGSDNAFLLTYGTGTPTTACTITFGTAWTTAPMSCVLTPGLAATAAVMQTDQVFVSSISTTQLVISSTTHLPASSKLYVQCM